MHDSAIALVSEGGEVLFACALERLTRVKQDGRPPYILLKNLPWEKISAIAVSTEKEYTPPEQPLSRIHPLQLPVPRKTGLVHGVEFHEFLNTLPAPKKYVCHHLSHAASAFWPSEFDNALCLTYDGGMSNCAWFGGLYRADKGGGIQPLDRFDAGHHAKITTLYTSVTALLGFTPNKHEGKITGLAAYGKPTAKCRELLWKMFTEDYFVLEEMTEWFFTYDRNTPPLLIVDGDKREKLLERLPGITKEEMAATVQAMAEEHILSILDNAAAQGWTSDHICLSGGLFANVKINQRVKEWGFRNVFISPPMTDDGTALGAALHVASCGEHFKPPAMREMFLGVKFSSEDIEKSLHHWDLDYEKIEFPADHLADELAGGAVVAIFQGAMEFGPRALGNRSIISQASDAGINDRLNARLLRTEFMPFAPITRFEDVSECYVGLEGAEHAAEFMTITCHCTESMLEKCPAVVHIDQTARPQLVNRERHPLLHDVLTSYKEKSGRPALINTSFNVHEEPIVCSPDDAIQGLLEAGLDYLYFEGGYLVTFNKNHQKALSYLQKKRGDPNRKSYNFQKVLLELHRRLNAAHRRDEEKEEEIRSLKADCNVKDEEILSLKKICEERESLIFQLDDRVRFLDRTNILGKVLFKVRSLLLSVLARITRPVVWMITPRLGILRQHSPHPLTLPERYATSLNTSRMPKISIVTPSYNQALYLERTILTVIEQGYPNLEYIVQDGGSEDGTREILLRYADKLTGWEARPDEGQSQAINLGFARTTGEIMAYLNSDDILFPGALSYVAAYFNQHPEVDVVYSHRIVIDEKDQQIGCWMLPAHDDGVLSWADYIPQETLFWRRSIWDRVGGQIDESFRFAMDWDLLVRFRNAGAHFSRLERFLAGFRVHAFQKTSVELSDIGQQEMDRIRQRELGWVPSQSEVSKALKPYLRKHIITDLGWRIRESLNKCK